MNLSKFSDDAAITTAREAIKDEPRVTGCHLWDRETRQRPWGQNGLLRITRLERLMLRRSKLSVSYCRAQVNLKHQEFYNCQHSIISNHMVRTCTEDRAGLIYVVYPKN
jgi:hypothetical protein